MTSASDKYLQFAAEIAETSTSGEQLYPLVVAQVRLADIAAELGVSRATIYKRWHTQHDLWTDLTNYVVAYVGQPRFGDHLQLPNVEGLSFPQALHAIGSALATAQRSLIADPGMLLRAGLLGYPDFDWATDERRLAERREFQTVVHIVTSALAQLRRRPVAGITVADITASLWSFADGIALAGRIVPEWAAPDFIVDADEGRSWTFLGYATRLVLIELTEPAIDGAGVEQIDGGPPGDWARVGPAQRWRADQLEVLTIGARMLIQILSSNDSHSSHAQPTAPLAHVSVARVARAAHVSPQAVYRVWPTRFALQAELFHHLHERERNAYLSLFDLMHDQLVSDPTRCSLKLAEVATSWQRDPTSRPPRARLVFNGYYHDAAVRELAGAELRTWITAHAARFEEMLPALGLHRPPGVSAESGAALAIVAANGCERLHLVDPTAVRRDVAYRGGTWSMFSVLSQAIQDHALAPLDPTSVE